MTAAHHPAPWLPAVPSASCHRPARKRPESWHRMEALRGSIQCDLSEVGSRAPPGVPRAVLFTTRDNLWRVGA